MIRPRRSLIVCLAPLALLGIAGAVSAAARTAHHANSRMVTRKALESALSQGPVGRQARRTANVFLSQVLGDPAAVESATLLRDVSVRSQTPQSQWSVLCDTRSGNYLLRINPETRRVYALNHMEDTDFGTLYNGSEEVQSEWGTDSVLDHPLSRVEAKAQAIRYLSSMGISPRVFKSTDLPPRLRPSGRHGNQETTLGTYSFAFADVRDPANPIVIAVDGATGGLQSLWSPVSPI